MTHKKSVSKLVSECSPPLLWWAFQCLEGSGRERRQSAVTVLHSLLNINIKRALFDGWDYFKMVSQRLLPCPQNQLIWKSVFDIRNLQSSSRGLLHPKSIEDPQVLMTEFLDCFWLGQDAVIGKGNRLVSTPHANYWLGHNILIYHSPDQMNESSALDITKLCGPLSWWAIYLELCWTGHWDSVWCDEGHRPPAGLHSSAAM